MNPLRQALAEYLAVRRALGYQLRRHELLLPQFIAYLEALGERYVTIKSALTWATLPKHANPYWWASRLSVVRCFAVHLHTRDPLTEVPPAGLLPRRSCRATPYLYSRDEIVSLLQAAVRQRSAHRAVTYQTLIALLAVTGMRVGEAIQLDRRDFDAHSGLLTIRQAKFNKSRELPLHRSTVEALRRYLTVRNRLRSVSRTAAFFVSTAGTRLHYANVQNTFHKLVHRVGLKPRSPSCKPRLHDLRHSFAVQTLLDAYKQKIPAGPQIAILATYLGHVDPAGTYWYLSAAPELMKLATTRLERFLRGET